MFYFNKKKSAAVIGLVLITGISGLVFWNSRSGTELSFEASRKATGTPIQTGGIPQTEVVLPLVQELERKEQEDMIVYVCGAVKQPGLVTVKSGQRVGDAIALAGGASEKADLSMVNLAQRVKDEEMVYIPKKGETLSNTTSTKGISVVRAAEPSDGKININTANVEELDKIPGVGPSTAQKIVDYRKSTGAFSRIEDICRVTGIGKKKFEQMKDKIKVH